MRDIRGDLCKPRISCITTVSRLNFKHLKRINQEVYEIGADEHMIRGISEFSSEKISISQVRGVSPTPYFIPVDGISNVYTSEEAREFKRIISSIWKNRESLSPMSLDVTNVRMLKSKHLTTLTYPHQKCVFATTQLVISPYGNVIPCLYYKNYHLGNLTNEDVSGVWGCQEHRHFCRSQQMHRIPLCDQCSIKFYHKSFIPSCVDVGRAAIHSL